jgi:hypothetical protein
MINRDDLQTDEERAVWDASYIGKVSALADAVTELKRAIYDALPKWLQRFLERP